jgi:hypothetical protein
MPGRTELLASLDEAVAALAANDASRLRWAPDARFAENCVVLPTDDGAWKTCTAIGDYQWSLADPVSGQAARFGTLYEHDDHALFVMRLALQDDGAVREFELLVARPIDAGVPFLTADVSHRPELSDRLSDNERGTRERVVELANGYFDTLERNDGILHTRFHPNCQRRENGMQTTSNPRPDLAPIAAYGCEEQFALGYYRFDNWIRARRYPLVDEEQGVVLSGGFIDHDGQTREYTLTNGETRTGFFLRPHSFAFLEAFKIRDDAISAVEAVFHFVPYRMPSPWAEDGPDPRRANITRPNEAMGTA